MQPENNPSPNNDPNNAPPAVAGSPPSPVPQPTPPNPQPEPNSWAAPATPQPTQQEAVPSQPSGPENSNSAQPIYGNNNYGQASGAPQTKKKKKLIFGGIAALAVLILGGSAGAYFGIYLPNQPNNLWRKALSNTATGYDRLVTYSKEQEQSKGATLKGNFKFDSADTVVDGNIDSKYYEKNSVTKIDAGAAGVRFNFDLLTNVPEGSKNPDLYVKVSGLKGIDQVLGAEAGGIGEALASYDNQWYVVDHTLFDQLEKEASSSGEGSMTPALTKEETYAIADSVGRVNRDYLFTDNADKAVFKLNQKIGKEKLDGRDTYHYKVGYDKEHLKAYTNAMKDELKKTKLNESIKDEDFNEILKSIDETTGNEEADAWVDMKTKTIRKVRFTDKDNQNNYLDVGMNYEGGDQYPFVMEVVTKEKDSEGKFKLTATLDTKANTVKFGANGEGTEAGQALKFTMDATLAPSNEQVQFQKPENPKSLIEAFGGLMGAGGESLMPTDAPAEPVTDDTEL